jgi:hypothetical protein
MAHFTIEPMTAPAIDRFCDAWTLAVHELLAALKKVNRFGCAQPHGRVHHHLLLPIHNSFVTSLLLDDFRVKEVTHAGHARWKYENEGHNILHIREALGP